MGYKVREGGFRYLPAGHPAAGKPRDQHMPEDYLTAEEGTEIDPDASQVDWLAMNGFIDAPVPDLSESESPALVTPATAEAEKAPAAGSI